MIFLVPAESSWEVDVAVVSALWLTTGGKYYESEEETIRQVWVWVRKAQDGAGRSMSNMYIFWLGEEVVWEIEEKTPW